jgi:hypothetical protein
VVITRCKMDLRVSVVVVVCCLFMMSSCVYCCF